MIRALSPNQNLEKIIKSPPKPYEGPLDRPRKVFQLLLLHLILVQQETTTILGRQREPRHARAPPPLPGAHVAPQGHQRLVRALPRPTALAHRMGPHGATKGFAPLQVTLRPPNRSAAEVWCVCGLEFLGVAPRRGAPVRRG